MCDGVARGEVDDGFIVPSSSLTQMSLSRTFVDDDDVSDVSCLFHFFGMAASFDVVVGKQVL